MKKIFKLNDLVELIIGLFLFYVFIVMLAYFFQRTLIYAPDQTKPLLHEWNASDMREVSIKTSDGLILTSWYKPAKLDQPTLLYLQGNQGNIGSRVAIIRPYLQYGYGALLLGYRGYGGNPGKPSETGFYKDVLAAWQFLKTQNIPNHCIVVYGDSLGTGAAVQLASQQKIGALILFAPYTSLVDLGYYHYPFLPISWFLKDRFESLAKIDFSKAPLLIALAEQDYVVPMRFGKQLFAAAPSPKKLIIYSGLGHNDRLQMSEKPMMDFITKHVDCRTLN